MTAEHLDPETTEPAQWEPWDDHDWWDQDAPQGRCEITLSDPRPMTHDDWVERLGLRRVADLRTAPGLLDDWHDRPCDGCSRPVAARSADPGIRVLCTVCHPDPLPLYVDDREPTDFDDEETRP
jgi:hypothetical protein